MTVTVEFTVGLPASGKTAYAKQRVAESGGQLRRVSMDALREMLDNGNFSPAHEADALRIQDEIIVRSVRAGYDVIVDNTHINKRMPDRIRAALAPYDVTWKVTDFRDVPVEECVRRDRERKNRGERSVGHDVIERMARRIHGWTLTEEWLGEYPKPEKCLPALLPAALLCDLDGTLALRRGRSPYDMARCGEDALDPMVAEVVDHYREAGVRIILVSGRDGRFRRITEEWLGKWGIKYDELHMRAEGDLRRDDIVKSEIFDARIRGTYDVRLVLDDRDRVVRMWRAMGLKTWQVAEGDF